MSDSFETERLLLVPLSEAHLPGFHKLWTDERCSKYSTRGATKTLDESRQWMQGVITSPDRPNIMNYAVFLRPLNSSSEPAADSLIGLVGVHKIDLSAQTAEVGYLFHPDSWGKGYASEAIRGFLPIFWAARPAVARLTGIVDKEHFPSQKVMTKNGFKEIEHNIEPTVLPLLGPEPRFPLLFELQRPSEPTESPPVYEAFTTERLQFVPLSEDHLLGYHQLWIDERCAKWSPRGPTKSLDESLQRLRIAITGPSNPEIINYAVFAHDSNDVKTAIPSPESMIAVFGIYVVDTKTRTGEIGYAFHPDSWGKGYATEALRGFLREFWTVRPNVDRITAIVDVPNVGSQKVLEKNGFKGIPHDLEPCLLPLVSPEPLIPLMYELHRPSS